MYAVNPVRDLWFDMSIAPNHGSVTGNPVAYEPFTGPVNVIVLAGASLGAARTITIQGTTEDPTAPGTPLAAGWAPLTVGGFCDPTSPMQITVDPALEPFATDQQQITREITQCRVDFMRAVIDVADPAVAVLFAGKARRVIQA